MRTRNQSKRPLDNIRDDVSKDALGRPIKRVKSRSEPDHHNADDTYLHKSGSPAILESGLETKNERSLQNTPITNERLSSNCEVKSIPAVSDQRFELEESEWEDGSVCILDSMKSEVPHEMNGVTVEFDISPDNGRRKTIRRATAEQKETAELVHKVNLLCLLGRGRLVDQACNDPLIQSCLWSLLPSHLLRIAEVPGLTAKTLTPLVNWFHHRLRVKDTGSAERTPSLALAHALEAQEGTAEEVAALSVALFRALNLTTRFVAVLDVTSLKPEVDKPEASSVGKSKSSGGIFNSSTLMVTRSRLSLSPSISPSTDMDSVGQTFVPCEKKMKSRRSLKAVIDASSMDHVKMSRPSTSTSEPCGASDAGQPKGKGDLEFEMQLNIALSATAIENSRSNASSNSSPSSKGFKVARREESSVSASGVATAIGSKKVGAPLYWAEVYCSGENLTGKWVHIDAVNAIIDGEQRVEAAAAACKKPLKYVVGFAGHGVKDVTRRYCTQWYKVASQRVNSTWWDAVLAPLKELESQATDMLIHMESETLSMKKVEAQDDAQRNEMSNSSTVKNHTGGSINHFAGSSSSLEDMELETRSLTEPLPTNQQAYKNHQLYAMERWLGKYQVLHPKGPVLGFCSGHPVYPRTCVQTLQTKVRWLREGCQVKANEHPVKIWKRSSKQNKVEAGEDDDPAEEDGQVSLFGKWQTEPLCLPHAVDGIVPKNERGQVDVWSEKCLPPGTVHLRLPRVWMVAKRLEIDYAPAMVGFEFRNGRSYPVFDGIVVCSEFKDAMVEAYDEEEERREAEERKRNEAQAVSRWYQLLSSVVMRQRLKKVYGENAGGAVEAIKAAADRSAGGGGGSSGDVEKGSEDKKSAATEQEEEHEHVHVFVVDDESMDEDSLTRTKRCGCGFSIEYEQM